jgi:hypothetical protein
MAAWFPPSPIAKRCRWSKPTAVTYDHPPGYYGMAGSARPLNPDWQAAGLQISDGEPWQNLAETNLSQAMPVAGFSPVDPFGAVRCCWSASALVFQPSHPAFIPIFSSADATFILPQVLAGLVWQKAGAVGGYDGARPDGRPPPSKRPARPIFC